MAKINKNFQKLKSSYLSVQINKRTKAFQVKHPGSQIYKLGIGNTTEPLPGSVISGLQAGVDKLSDVKTYTGYGEETGDNRLREALSEKYSKNGIILDFQEIFISDGAKPDTANIQSIFSIDSVVAVQDPVYPVYVETNVIAGRTGEYENGKYKGLVYLPCTKENNFVPYLPEIKVDLMYLCSPNNPTGAVLTKEQLKKFVDYALKNKAIIIYDAAYEAFIRNNDLPHSIYEIEGAKECAIEVGSFSKSSGFTGVRVGWTVVPMDLVGEDAKKGEVNALWARRQVTMFNGASNIAQEGALAVLSDKGQKECNKIVAYYMENAQIIKTAFDNLGFEVFGGENAPYIWIKTPGKLTSWEFFDKLLDEAHVVGTPGSIFGPHGEGYFRLSAFGHREDIEKAVKSIEEKLKI